MSNSSGAELTIVVPNRGIWGTAGIGGANLDRHASWQWQGSSSTGWREHVRGPRPWLVCVEAGDTTFRESTPEADFQNQGRDRCWLSAIGPSFPQLTPSAFASCVSWTCTPAPAFTRLAQGHPKRL